MRTSERPRFEDLTETTGIPVTTEGASMMYTRYEYAASNSARRAVLEIGCGAGQGLGLLSAAATSIIGGDYSEALLRSAKSHYRDRIPLAGLSADALPFRNGAFDLVLFFEASYYVRDVESAFDELRRVLRAGGRVIFVNANPERADFIRSPESTHYHTAEQFRSALTRRGFAVTVEGAFPVEAANDRVSLASRLVGAVLRLARQALEMSRLTPKTLRGRARLKRLLNRRLVEVPPELAAGFGAVEPRATVPTGPVRNFKVLYITASLAA